MPPPPEPAATCAVPPPLAIICARRYRDGKLDPEPLEIASPPRQPLPHGTFDWVGLAEPTAEEMEQVAAAYRLHPLAVEDALTRSQAPKLDVYEQQTFIVARTVALDGDNPENLVYGQTAIFVGCDFIITVRFGSAREHAKLRAKLEKDPEHLAQGPDYVAHAVLDFIVDGIAPIIDEVEKVVRELEDSAIAGFPDPDTIRRMFHLRRQLRRFEFVVGPMEEVCQKLVSEDLPAIDKSSRIWFRDVYDHIHRAMSYVHGLSETLAQIVETGGLLEQHKQGEITRQLAAWAAILAVPTAIAGIYGMNFQYFPELHWHYGYFAVIGLMATICIGLWLRFRSIGWL